MNQKEATVTSMAVALHILFCYSGPRLLQKTASAALPPDPWSSFGCEIGKLATHNPGKGHNLVRIPEELRPCPGLLARFATKTSLCPGSAAGRREATGVLPLDSMLFCGATYALLGQ
jgi:hypothetical protein